MSTRPQILPELEELLPHRPPMVLLDHLLEYDETSATARASIRPDTPLVENGSVSAVLALEQMAQATAAFMGLRARARARPVGIGYLLGARELELHVDRFEVGDVVLVRVRHAWGEGDLAMFECEVEREGRVVAEATINVLSSVPHE